MVAGASAAPATKPHIVFVFVDDWGYGFLNPASHQVAQLQTSLLSCVQVQFYKLAMPHTGWVSGMKVYLSQ